MLLKPHNSQITTAAKTILTIILCILREDSPFQVDQISVSRLIGPGVKVDITVKVSNGKEWLSDGFAK